MLATQTLAKERAMNLQAGALALAAIFLSSAAFAERKYSDWDTPVNLGCGTINSAVDDFGPAISKDGLSLYLSSNRPGSTPTSAGTLSNDIWAATRPSVNDPWDTPVNVTAVNSASIDSNASFSRDGHWMFFNSDRPGSMLDAMGLPSVDIWASYREHVHDNLDWGTPFNLGPGVNTAGFDGGASYFENDGSGAPQLYFGSGAAQAVSDIWVAELLPDGTFGNRQRVTALNSEQNDQRPSIRFDGLEMFFWSNRPGSTPNVGASTLSNDIWVATRKSVNDDWDPPMNLGPRVNSAFGDFNPQISPDALTLYFGSNRPGGCGGFDIYKTTRKQLKGSD
jgi:Tol biopolymer transport system component